MKYYLGWNTDEKLKTNISKEEIEDAILELDEYPPTDFRTNIFSLILEEETYVCNCAYILAYYYKSQYNDGEYIVEIALKGDNNDDHPKVYQYTTLDIRIVINIFINYFEKQQIPDLAIWKEVTDDIR